MIRVRRLNRNMVFSIIFFNFICYDLIAHLCDHVKIPMKLILFNAVEPIFKTVSSGKGFVILSVVVGHRNVLKSHIKLERHDEDENTLL